MRGWRGHGGGAQATGVYGVGLDRMPASSQYSGDGQQAHRDDEDGKGGGGSIVCRRLALLHESHPVTWAAAFVVEGSGPAPMVTGSKKATMAASEPRPGPQVPPAAGLGSPTNKPVTAKAAPKSPRLTRTIITHQHGSGLHAHSVSIGVPIWLYMVDGRTAYSVHRHLSWALISVLTWALALGETYRRRLDFDD